jgi:hypothetical protein
MYDITNDDGWLDVWWISCSIVLLPGSTEYLGFFRALRTESERLLVATRQICLSRWVLDSYYF